MRSTSSTNLAAALSLRSKYQARADFKSESAAGWISSGLAPIENGRDLPSGFGPGNRLYFAGIQFLDPARDLLTPGFLGGGVYRLIQTLQERACQRGSRLNRQGQRLLQKLRNLFRHGVILLRCPIPS